jgi:hypothetical protein
MYYAFIISVVSVISIVSILISIQRRTESVLAIELSLKFKYVGGAFVIISIFLSFFELVEDEIYSNIRIIIANLGLIIIALSKDKIEVKDSNIIKMACFSLSTFISYLVNHLMVIFFQVEETIELSRFILDLLIIYLISYQYIKYKLKKGV